MPAWTGLSQKQTHPSGGCLKAASEFRIRCGRFLRAKVNLIGLCTCIEGSSMLQERLHIPSAEVRSLPERRRQIRQLALLRVALLHAGGASDICVVRNVSPNGLSARVYRKFRDGDEVEIEFRSGELLAGSVVWEEEYDIGIVFPRPIDV